MTFGEFKDFIEEQDALLRSLKKSDSEKERILARTVKLGEEFGELCDEVLASFGIQRKSKLEARNTGDLEDEFADVVITVFLLAKSMHIDMAPALEERIGTLRAKHAKELEKEIPDG